MGLIQNQTIYREVGSLLYLGMRCASVEYHHDSFDYHVDFYGH